MIISKLKAAASAAAEIGAEFVAGMIADRVETLIASRKKVHEHYPKKITTGSINSGYPMHSSGGVWLLGVLWDAKRNAYVAGIRVCGGCGELYYYEET